MSLELSPRAAGNVTVLDVSGSLGHGEGSRNFRETIRDLLANGQTNILVNAGGVSYIDSSGIGELVSAFTSVTTHGGQFKLLNTTKRLRDLLLLTKLSIIFDVYDDEATALRSFG